MRTNSRRNTEQSFQKALITLLSLRLRTECSAPELRKFVSKCTENAIDAHAQSTPWHGIDVNEMGSILRTWHVEATFLTAAGKPRPLRIDGLRQLVRKHFPHQQFTKVLSTLKLNGLIRRQKTGYWMPNERHARIPKPTAELLSHFGESIVRLADTVTKNISSTNKRSLLFERAAKVECLPPSDVAAFRDYVAEQATAFISTIDDWLESRAVRKKRVRSGVCVAGVHAFAFLDETPKAGSSSARQRAR